MNYRMGGMAARICTGFFIFFSLAILAGCAPKSVEKEQPASLSRFPPSELSLEEQRKEAFIILREILVLSNDPDREKNLPAMKALYREIIDRYPDIGLAQESYMRLIFLARDEGTPEGDAEAERVFAEFVQKYPDSPLRPMIANELQTD